MGAIPRTHPSPRLFTALGPARDMLIKNIHTWIENGRYHTREDRDGHSDQCMSRHTYAVTYKAMRSEDFAFCEKLVAEVLAQASSRSVKRCVWEKVKCQTDRVWEDEDGDEGKRTGRFCFDFPDNASLQN